MAELITPESLRSIANDRGSPFWESWARQALLWAADTLEAAQRVIEERISSGGTPAPDSRTGVTGEAADTGVFNTSTDRITENHNG